MDQVALADREGPGEKGLDQVDWHPTLRQDLDRLVTGQAGLAVALEVGPVVLAEEAPVEARDASLRADSFAALEAEVAAVKAVDGWGAKP